VAELAIRTIGDPLRPPLSYNHPFPQAGILWEAYRNVSTLTVTLTVAALGYGGPSPAEGRGKRESYDTGTFSHFEPWIDTNVNFRPNSDSRFRPCMEIMDT